MRTPREDAEVTKRLREFDYAAARLQYLGISRGHLRLRVDQAREVPVAPATTEQEVPGDQ